MLCGEFRRASPLSIAESRSPFYALLTLSQGMAAVVGPEEDDIYLENGMMSYENPNYHLDPARLDDALNSNLDSNVEEDLYEEIINELEGVCRVSRGRPGSGEGRKSYAALDITSMGVDVTTGPVTNLDSNIDDCDNRSSDSTGSPLDNSYHHNRVNMGRRPLEQRTKPDLIEDAEYRCNRDNAQKKAMQQMTVEIDGVPHIQGQLNAEDLYAVPVKQRVTSPCPPPDVDTPDKDELPPGWEKHEDNDGPYYWHIKSGTIQRDPPKETKEKTSTTPGCREQLLKSSDDMTTTIVNCVTRSNTSSALESIKDKKEEQALKRRSYPSKAENETKERPIRFAVRSLGWVEIAEEDLTPERSSKAVNRCIVDLSLGRNDLLDVVGRWGDGKDLFMDLDEGALKLMDPEKLTVLNTQPIHTIRVWGVGRDNGRDFAYVARDRTTRRHMCHVFRCDIPARTIANTLRDICKKIMIERSLQQSLAKPIDVMNGGKTGLAVRPTNLPTEHRRHNKGAQPLVNQSFPTPMEEPKKVLCAQYLGSLQVTRATGMEVLNDAIEQLSSAPQETWRQVSIAVAPSMISISLPGQEEGGALICECRVRYLSFMGIGHNVKNCGFIMHTAQDLFIAHVFYCEPSSGALCKTIEAACKLRYQKCLDAHPQGGVTRSQTDVVTPGKSIGATLKSFMGSLTGRRAKGPDS